MFFLEDPIGGKSPAIDERAVRIWSTRSCIIVGSLAFMDGETYLVASTSVADVQPTEPAFDGMLDTPSRVVEISTSERQVLLRCAVAALVTRVRVWTDRPSEPENILVVFG
jgi:hypothetical protein